MLVQTDKQLATLQELVQSIEFARIEKDVLYGLKQGTTVLKQLNNEMKIEDVEKLMGETADAIAYQKEVDEMLQSQMSVEDEEAVQAELAAMEEDQVCHFARAARTAAHFAARLAFAPRNCQTRPRRCPNCQKGWRTRVGFLHAFRTLLDANAIARSGCTRARRTATRTSRGASGMMSRTSLSHIPIIILCESVCSLSTSKQAEACRGSAGLDHVALLVLDLLLL